jgi:cytochrome b561
VQSDGRFYTPHTYIGVAVSALFVGRLLYRFLTVYDGALPSNGFPGSYQGNPFTLAVFGVVVGYYVFYYLGVLQRTRLASAVAVSK